ncbi:MAG: flagellar hook-associated protein FlgK [Rhodobacteraceae bacterium]|nr:flagellar hook-associated protein FlgK [Paracoccaceae bacterium]
MSISTALANAVSGLAAQSRAAEVISGNVANALTEGYGRREVVLSPRSVGGQGAGVSVDGVTRIVDPVILRDRRAADADAAFSGAAQEFSTSYLSLLGSPEDPLSLSGVLRALDQSLIEAASRPDLPERLAGVVDSATRVSNTFNSVSDGLQAMRQNADAEISRTVEALNSDLARVEELNALILRYGSSGRDVAALEDQRQRVIDRVAPIVPLQVLQRDNGTLALYSKTGAALVDPTAATIGFTATPTITADMTLASGALSGLTINGRAVSVGSANDPFTGGKLDGLFAIRDDLAVSAQADVDALASDLYARLSDPGVDPTLLAGAPGLFTDGGGALDPLDTIGFSGRIGVNALVDPLNGGAYWRLRDGLGAVAEGSVGNATLLTTMQSALQAPRSIALPGGASPSRSMSELAGEVQSLAGVALVARETQATFATARQEGLRELEFASGVDTDQELQKLLAIETAYAANAQVIRTADELTDILLGL